MNLKTLSISAVVVAVAALSLAQGGKVESLQGKTMVPFKMTDNAGKSHTNQSLKGKVVLIDFWATWCGPCKKGMPSMQRLHAKYAKQGLVVIGANVWEKGPAGEAAAVKYAKDNKFTYTFTKKNDTLAEKIGVQGIPTMILVDRKGVVRKVDVGFSPSHEAQLEADIRRLLAAR